MKIIKNANGDIDIHASNEEGMALLMYAEEWAGSVMEDEQDDPYWRQITKKLGDAVDLMDEEGQQQYEFSFDFPPEEEE